MITDTQEQISINVIIADRPYRLKVKPEEEENVRKAAKLINNRVKEYQNSYAAKDKQDYVSMCALMYAVEHINRESGKGSDFAPIIEQLDSIAQRLTEALQP
jgi:cell division protein ZapA